MNCSNCGAAMELHAARRYFFCGHCGSFRFPEVVDEGVQLLARDQGPAQCAACRLPLAAALIDDRIDAHYCERCRGVLLSRANFAGIVETRRAWASTPPVIPAPIDPRELERSLPCPMCTAEMSTHPYYGPGNVVIDTCDRCQVVWLDFGELRQIADAPGRDRGRPPRPSGERGENELDVLGLLAARVARREEE